MAPMPNPEWYEEKESTRVSLQNLRKLSLKDHVEVWSSTWKWYKDSFGESFDWGRRRKEEAKRKEAQEKLDALQSMVKDAREATHNSPEDLEKSKQALKELMEEIHENRDGLKSAAQEKLALIRVSLSEFSLGYREARDEEIKRVMAMDEGMLKSFLNERVGEVKRATSVISDAILDKDEDTKRSSTTGKIAASTGGVTHTPTPPGTPLGAGAKATPDITSSTDHEGDNAVGPSRFLSQRTRQAMDDVIRDPDIERLTGRAKGFARERLLQAEAAARVLKEDGGEGGVKTRTSAGGDKRHPTRESESETPIISGLVSDASEFVAGRVGEAKEGVREVVEAAIDVRRSRQKAAAAATERSANDGEGGRGDGVGGAGRAGEGGKEGGKK
eukprot:g7452.t1